MLDGEGVGVAVGFDDGVFWPTLPELPSMVFFVPFSPSSFSLPSSLSEPSLFFLEALLPEVASAPSPRLETAPRPPILDLCVVSGGVHAENIMLVKRTVRPGIHRRLLALML